MVFVESDKQKNSSQVQQLKSYKEIAYVLGVSVSSGYKVIP